MKLDINSFLFVGKICVFYLIFLELKRKSGNSRKYVAEQFFYICCKVRDWNVCPKYLLHTDDTTDKFFVNGLLRTPEGNLAVQLSLCTNPLCMYWRVVTKHPLLDPHRQSKWCNQKGELDTKIFQKVLHSSSHSVRARVHSILCPTLDNVQEACFAAFLQARSQVSISHIV